MWCNVHGHCVSGTRCRGDGQLTKIAHSSLAWVRECSLHSAGEAARGTRTSPEMRLDKVFYSDNGSTAVEVACKMAHQYWRNIGRLAVQSKRSRFIAFEGGISRRHPRRRLGRGDSRSFHNAFQGALLPGRFRSRRPGDRQRAATSLDYGRDFAAQSACAIRGHHHRAARARRGRDDRAAGRDF